MIQHYHRSQHNRAAHVFLTFRATVTFSFHMVFMSFFFNNIQYAPKFIKWMDLIAPEQYKTRRIPMLWKLPPVC